MKAIIAAAAALLLLTGCAQQLAAVRAVGAEAVETKKQINDMEARFSLIAICNMSVGSYWRVLSPEQRRLVDAVCAGGVSGQ